MNQEEAPISLNLNQPPAVPAPDPTVPVEELQFRHVEPVDAQPASRRCVACKSPIYSTYYQVVGKDVCPNCAQQIQNSQQAPPAHSMLKAFLYGGGAALAGCALYAAIAIFAHLELALIAILIGYMVGKAIRHASNGLGGRPQQILAVVLTYFAITFSYVVVYIYEVSQKPSPAAQTSTEKKGSPAPAVADSGERPSLATALVAIIGLGAIAPFLELGSNFMSGMLSLVIIFFGLQRAWRMTGRSKLQIFGPFNAAAETA